MVFIIVYRSLDNVHVVICTKKSKLADNIKLINVLKCINWTLLLHALGVKINEKHNNNRAFPNILEIFPLV